MRILIGLLFSISLLAAPESNAGDLGLDISGFTDLGESANRTLADPATPSACSYLDLDANRTFEYGESSQKALADPRQWIRQHGVDLMCESREPVKGLVAYDMAIHATQDSIDEPRDFDAVSKQLELIDLEPMKFLPVSDSFPQTFLFRTHDDAVGVLELSEPIDHPSGYRVRFRLIKKLPPPLPAEAVVEQLRRDEQLLAGIKARRGAPLVTAQIQKRIKLAAELLQISQKEREPKIASLKTALAIRRYQLAELKAALPTDATQVVELQRNADSLAKMLHSELAKYEMPQFNGIAPVILLPVRPPAGQAAPSGK